MGIEIRRSEERGQADYGWLQAAYTFSFAHYFDPRYLGFRNLRVLNEDRVAPQSGFPEHGHRDMEILTYVLSGSLKHTDSEGNVGYIRAGMVQRMTAGTGIRHSEWNPYDDPLHLLQIWIEPRSKGLPAGYEEKAFPEACSEDRLQLMASPDGRDGSLTLHAEAELWAGHLHEGITVEQTLTPGGHAWVHVARGAVELNGRHLATGDGAGLSDVIDLRILAKGQAQVLVFSLA